MGRVKYYKPIMGLQASKLGPTRRRFHVYEYRQRLDCQSKIIMESSVSLVNINFDRISAAKLYHQRILRKRFTISPRNLNCQSSHLRWKLIDLYFFCSFRGFVARFHAGCYAARARASTWARSQAIICPPWTVRLGKYSGLEILEKHHTLEDFNPIKTLLTTTFNFVNNFMPFCSFFNRCNELRERCKVVLANKDEELKAIKTRYTNMTY